MLKAGENSGWPKIPFLGGTTFFLRRVRGDWRSRQSGMPPDHGPQSPRGRRPEAGGRDRKENRPDPERSRGGGERPTLNFK